MFTLCKWCFSEPDAVIYINMINAWNYVTMQVIAPAAIYRYSGSSGFYIHVCMFQRRAYLSVGNQLWFWLFDLNYPTCFFMTSISFPYVAGHHPQLGQSLQWWFLHCA